MKAFWFYSEARSLHRIPEYGAPSVNVAQKILLTDFYVVQFFFWWQIFLGQENIVLVIFFKIGQWPRGPLLRYNLKCKLKHT